MNPTRSAILMSGGIGDFLHYLARLPHFVEKSGVDSDSITIFVEATAPDQVRRAFTLAFPGLRFVFVPSRLHWTVTNPLLVPHRDLERIQRPAYRYVKAQGISDITDWFLPFLCADLRVSKEPLMRIVRAGNVPIEPYVVVSARDKGFLWWPTVETFHEIERLMSATHRIFFLGTEVERQVLGYRVETAEDVAQALSLSYHADLFIGTDTGLATIRELTGKKNIYCIDEFWFEELMKGYGYIDERVLDASKSVFAYGTPMLFDLIAAHSPARASAD